MTKYVFPSYETLAHQYSGEFSVTPQLYEIAFDEFIKITHPLRLRDEDHFFRALQQSHPDYEDSVHARLNYHTRQALKSATYRIAGK